jgi:hypothetical protein
MMPPQKNFRFSLSFSRFVFFNIYIIYTSESERGRGKGGKHKYGEKDFFLDMAGSSDSLNFVASSSIQFPRNSRREIKLKQKRNEKQQIRALAIEENNKKRKSRALLIEH